MNGVMVFIFCFLVCTCSGQKKLCADTDEICKSMEFITALSKKSLSRAKKFVRLNKDSGLLGMTREMYVEGFKHIRQILKTHGLPNKTAYNIVRLSTPPGDLVEVVLIDSSMLDKQYVFLKLDIYFNDVQDENIAFIIGFRLNGKSVNNDDDDVNEKLIEAIKKYPYPK